MGQEHVKSTAPPDADALPWWKKTTVYQIYPRSYMDSNGDGIGDIKGIISKLDYIRDLGVETVWFSPFYTSPQADFGYDIADYRGISPEYGNMADCDELIDEIHKRNMKIVFDMVMNHTSDQHPWFLESRKSKDNPKRDWYIWRDGAKPHGKAPPNRWRAMPGGSGWEYDKTTDQWFYHQFLSFQPDLNYRCPEVKQMIFDTVRFWLRKKVDGFRLDIINAIYENEDLKENPFTWRVMPSDKTEDSAIVFRSTKYTLNHPDTYKFTKELRSVIEEFKDPSRFLVGEVTGSSTILRRYCGENADGLNSVFIFKSLTMPLKAAKFRALIQECEEFFPEPYIPTWVFGNHDQPRRISRLNNSIEKAKLNMAVQLTARGVPYIYYGDEIGMVQHSIPLKQSLDAVALQYTWIPQFLLKIIQNVAGLSLNRDECRTPMQWDGSPKAGFTSISVKPWLPISPMHEQRNVETELSDSDSLLNAYRRFLKVRQKMPALNAGSLILIDMKEASENIIGYYRESIVQGKSQKAAVLLNFSAIPQIVANPLSGAKLAVSTHIATKTVDSDKIELKPWEGLVLN